MRTGGGVQFCGHPSYFFFFLQIAKPSQAPFPLNVTIDVTNVRQRLA